MRYMLTQHVVNSLTRTLRRDTLRRYDSYISNGTDKVHTYELAALYTALVAGIRQVEYRSKQKLRFC